LQTQVAIKFMAATVSDDPVSVKRFAREARAAAQIKSPHVVQTHDHGVTDDGIPYIVMELLEGESLDKRLRRMGPLNLVDAVQIIVQVCKALAKAHEIGIVHRDIKPANIFLIESGNELFVKVLDFGVAKFAGDQAVDMTAAGHMVGTPSYMSPEQYFDAKGVSYRSDLWSLGIVAYVALTGARPFAGSTLAELVVSIKSAHHDPPSAIRRDLPSGVDDWMKRALSPAPTDRFASAKDMAQALERAVGLASVMTSSPSLVGTGASHVVTFSGSTSASNALLAASATAIAPPFRRSGLIVAVVAVALIVAAGVGAAALIVGRSEPAQAASSGATTEPSAERATSPAGASTATATAAPEIVVVSPASDAGAPTSASSATGMTPPKTTPGTGTGRPPQDERLQRAKDKLGI
jgi:serine/threonine-protein kinase